MFTIIRRNVAMTSSKEIVLHPENYDLEVDQFANSVMNVSAVESKQLLDVKKKSMLESMDMMVSILETFTKSMEAYVALSKKDVSEMKSIKEKWVNKDAEIAHDIEGT